MKALLLENKSLYFLVTFLWSMLRIGGNDRELIGIQISIGILIIIVFKNYKNSKWINLCSVIFSILGTIILYKTTLKLESSYILTIFSLLFILYLIIDNISSKQEDIRSILGRKLEINIKTGFIILILFISNALILFLISKLLMSNGLVTLSSIIGTILSLFSFIASLTSYLYFDKNIIENKNSSLNKVFYLIITVVQGIIGVIILIYLGSIITTNNYPSNSLGRFIPFYLLFTFGKIFLYTKYEESIIEKIFFWITPVYIFYFFVVLLKRITEYSMTDFRYSMLCFGLLSSIIFLLNIFCKKVNKKLILILISSFVVLNLYLYSNKSIVKLYNKNFKGTHKIVNQEKKNYISLDISSLKLKGEMIFVNNRKNSKEITKIIENYYFKNRAYTGTVNIFLKTKTSESKLYYTNENLHKNLSSQALLEEFKNIEIYRNDDKISVGELVSRYEKQSITSDISHTNLKDILIFKRKFKEFSIYMPVHGIQLIENKISYFNFHDFYFIELDKKNKK